MASLSDEIERHLLERLGGLGIQSLEIQRNELSEMFRCVPSQINYVLDTRFTRARGFLVESRRGGAGYIRIVRLSCPGSQAVRSLLERHVGEQVAQEQAGQLVSWLREEGLLTSREAIMIRAAVDRQTLGLPLPVRDAVRARILWAMLLNLFRSEAGGGGQADNGNHSSHGSHGGEGGPGHAL